MTSAILAFYMIFLFVVCSIYIYFLRDDLNRTRRELNNEMSAMHDRFQSEIKNLRGYYDEMLRRRVDRYEG